MFDMTCVGLWVCKEDEDEDEDEEKGRTIFFFTKKTSNYIPQ